MKRLLRFVLRLVGQAFYHLGLARMVIGLRHSKRVLLYHDVSPQEDVWNRGLSGTIDPKLFAKHCRFFRIHYHPSNLHLTFDDGLASLYHHAWPILRQVKLPTTIFLVAQTLTDRAIWTHVLTKALNENFYEAKSSIAKVVPEISGETVADVISQLKEKAHPELIESLMRQFAATSNDLYLDDQQIASMRKSGVIFGNHSYSHANLVLCTSEEFESDVRRSKKLMDSRGVCNDFAFPFGAASVNLVAKAKELGFENVYTVGYDLADHENNVWGRIDPTGWSVSRLFAELEVVEPILNFLRAHMTRGDLAYAKVY